MKINFFAPINHLGYGVHAYNLIKSFEKLGHQPTLIPPFGKTILLDDHAARWIERQKNIDVNIPGIMIFHEEFLAQFSGKPRIGFPVFEMEEFTEIQAAMIRACNYVFTPSEWGKKILIKNEIPEFKIRIVREGYDPEIYKPDFAFKQGVFTFLAAGKLEERKGIIQTIRCFSDALKNEDVKLIVHCRNEFDIKWHSKVEKEILGLGFMTSDGDNYYRGNQRIEIIPAFIKDMNILYSKADFGIFLSRAEGWNLPLIEMIACGIPCIAGSWTGQSEYYLNNQFSIKNYSEEIANDGYWFLGNRGKWNVPDDNVKSLMIKAFQDGKNYRTSDEWKIICDKVREFTWDRAAKELCSAIESVVGI